MEHEFFRQSFENTQISYFMKIRPVGSDIAGEKKAEGVWEHGVEENILN